MTTDANTETPPLFKPVNTMGYPNRSREAIVEMETWHDDEGHLFALDMCDHPACRAFSSLASVAPLRTGFAANIQAAVNNFIGRGSTGERVRNTDLYMKNERRKPEKKGSKA